VLDEQQPLHKRTPSALRWATSSKGLHTQQLQPQAVNAIEDAEQVRLVLDQPGEYRLPVLGLHAHPLKSTGVPFADLATHHYAVDLACALLADNRSSSLAPYADPSLSARSPRRGCSPAEGRGSVRPLGSARAPLYASFIGREDANESLPEQHGVLVEQDGP
jgi:hypothetical protein